MLRHHHHHKHYLDRHTVASLLEKLKPVVSWLAGIHKMTLTGTEPRMGSRMKWTSDGSPA